MIGYKVIFDRQQYVLNNGMESELLGMKWGVPQGSVLGPTMYLIYVNYIADLPLTSTIVMFADDTAVGHSHKNPNALQTIVQRDLDVLFHWFAANKLTVNPSKTKALSFDKSVTRATCDSRDQGLTSNNQTIEFINNLD